MTRLYWEYKQGKEAIIIFYTYNNNYTKYTELFLLSLIEFLTFVPRPTPLFKMAIN